jgi:hypothetical protein
MISGAESSVSRWTSQNPKIMCLFVALACARSVDLVDKSCVIAMDLIWTDAYKGPCEEKRIIY